MAVTYYKKYELSLSLNGDKVVHIARNAAGNVVFREPTEKALKTAIDNSIKEEQARLEKNNKHKKTKTVVKLLSVEEVPVEETEEEREDGDDQSILTPPVQQRVIRGPDGKFISRRKLQEEEKKKSFWEKLTS